MGPHGGASVARVLWLSPEFDESFLKRSVFGQRFFNLRGRVIFFIPFLDIVIVTLYTMYSASFLCGRYQAMMKSQSALRRNCPFPGYFLSKRGNDYWVRNPSRPGRE